MMIEHFPKDTAYYLEKLGDVLEEGWCQGAYAQGEDGENLDIEDPRAVSHCLIGGLYAVVPGVENTYMRNAMREALCQALERPSLVSGTTLAGWNDAAGRKKEEVVSLCKRAAKRLREQ